MLEYMAVLKKNPEQTVKQIAAALGHDSTSLTFDLANKLYVYD